MTDKTHDIMMNDIKRAETLKSNIVAYYGSAPFENEDCKDFVRSILDRAKRITDEQYDTYFNVCMKAIGYLVEVTNKNKALKKENKELKSKITYTFESHTVGELRKVLSAVPNSYTVYVSGSAECGYVGISGTVDEMEIKKSEELVMLNTYEEG